MSPSLVRGQKMCTFEFLVLNFCLMDDRRSQLTSRTTALRTLDQKETDKEAQRVTLQQISKSYPEFFSHLLHHLLLPPRNWSSCCPQDHVLLRDSQPGEERERERKKVRETG